MPLLALSVPLKVRVCFTILNLALCGVSLGVVYRRRLQKIQLTKICATGLSCIVLAFLYCVECLVTDFKANSTTSADGIWCKVSMKLITVTYILHRVLVYTYIILRLEILNQSNFLSFRIISAAKAVVGVTGTFMVLSAIIYTKGVIDQNFHCAFEAEDLILVCMLMIDTSTCVSGTFLFIRPIERVLRDIEDSSLRNTLRTTKRWSIVCLLSTLLVMLIIVVVDGGAAFVVFDCSITAFSLAMMMSPRGRELPSESKDSWSHGAIVEFDQSSCQKKPSSDPNQMDLSEISTNMLFRSTSSLTI